MKPTDSRKVLILLAGACLLAFGFWLKGSKDESAVVPYQPTKTIKLHSKEYAGTNMLINLWCDQAHTKVCDRMKPGATLEYESFDGKQYRLKSGYYISAVQVESRN